MDQPLNYKYNELYDNQIAMGLVQTLKQAVGCSQVFPLFSFKGASTNPDLAIQYVTLKLLQKLVMEGESWIRSKFVTPQVHKAKLSSHSSKNKPPHVANVNSTPQTTRYDLVCESR